MLNLSRDEQLNLEAAAKNYREAFATVQAILEGTDLGRVPPWIFAVGRMTIPELKTVSDELAEAEQYRRSCRIALHSYVELLALELGGDPMEVAPQVDEDAIDTLVDRKSDPEESLTSFGGTGQRRLDAFICVMNYARGGNAIYVNGTFEAVVRGPEKS